MSSMRDLKTYAFFSEEDLRAETVRTVACLLCLFSTRRSSKIT